MEKKPIPAEWLPQYTYADYEQWQGDWELIYGIPFAMSPSPKRLHQATSRQFVLLLQKALEQKSETCGCEVYYELDWIIANDTVVRPDIMVVCGQFDSDFLRFAPALVVEITAKRTQMADRNVKFRLYEKSGVPYYIIADPDRSATEIFQLLHGKYKEIKTNHFSLSESCRIEFDAGKLWQP